MIFQGTVPREVLAQMAKLLAWHAHRDVFVCCSGTFRFEQLMAQVAPESFVHSNDVALLPVMLGEVKVTGNAPAHRLREEVPSRIAELPGETGLAALSRLMVLMEWCAISGSSLRARNQRLALEARADVLQAEAIRKLHPYLEGMRSTAFFAGDFRDHAERARVVGGAVAAFLPTYKGGYERMFKKVHGLVEWEAPSYRMFDPKDLPAWVREVANWGIPYAIFSDQLIDGLTPISACKPGRNRMIYLFGSSGRPTWVSPPPKKADPFDFRPVDGATLTRDSICEVTPTTSQRAVWLKNRYLAAKSEHVSCKWNYLVWVDGKLVGAFGYAKSTFSPHNSLYMMFDLCISRDGRLSKLVSLLATLRPCIRPAEVEMAAHMTQLATTAFTTKPVSMKYRGVWDLWKRGDGFLQYAATPRDIGVQDAYQLWFDRWRK